MYGSAGTFTVTLTVTDDGGLTDTSTSTATISDVVNTPPEAFDDAYATDEDVLLSVGIPGVLGNDFDVDGDSLTAVLVGDVSDGTLALNANGTFSYMPNSNFFGSDSFTYVANDGVDDSNVATVTIAVNLVNDGPVADADGPYGGTVGLPVVFDGSGSSDVDGTIVSYEWDFGDGGTGSGVSPTHMYGSAGTFTVTLTVTDDGGLTDSDTSTATIAPAVADLDIRRFRAPNKVRLDKFRPFKLTLEVDNEGNVDIPDASFGATATIVGVQDDDDDGGEDGDVVYTSTFPIWDAISDGTTKFDVEVDDDDKDLFSTGEVMWTVTLDVPGDPDTDEAVAYTMFESRHFINASRSLSAGLFGFAIAGISLTARKVRRRR
jgi:PKD repeat protein